METAEAALKRAADKRGRKAKSVLPQMPFEKPDLARPVLGDPDQWKDLDLKAGDEDEGDRGGGGAPERDAPDGGAADGSQPSAAAQASAIAMADPRLVPVAALVPSPKNPRFIHDQKADAGLVESVRAHGLLVPLLVRPLPLLMRKRDKPGEYEVLDGHRRLTAARAAGLEMVPAIVHHLDDRAAVTLMVTANLQRENLHPLEDAKGIATLLGLGLTIQDVADQLRVSPGWVARRAKLGDLIDAWQQQALDEGSPVSRWPAAMLERIAALSADLQSALFTDLKHTGFNFGLNAAPTLKDLDVHLNNRYLRRLSSAPWKLDDATLSPAAGPCDRCALRSSAAPLLFDLEVTAAGQVKNDSCLNPACWQEKSRRHLSGIKQSLAKEHKVVLGVSEAYGKEREKVAKNFAGKVIQSWERGEPCKKTHPDAVPLVHLDGAAMGQVEWVKRPKAAWGGDSRRGGGTSNKPAKKTLTLAERRKELRTRRTAWLLEELAERLRKYAPLAGKPVPLPEPALQCHDAKLMALAAVFGTHNNAGYEPPPGLRVWKDFEKRAAMDRLDIRAALWRKVIPVLIDRLRENAPEHHGAALLLEAEQVCELMGWDYQGLLNQADLALPEPEEWSRLAADGTIKTVASGPAKPASKRGRKAVRS